MSENCQLPKRRIYWEREQECRSELIANVLFRDSFEYIMTNFHWTIIQKYETTNILIFSSVTPYIANSLKPINSETIVFYFHLIVSVYQVSHFNHSKTYFCEILRSGKICVKNDFTDISFFLIIYIYLKVL